MTREAITVGFDAGDGFLGRCRGSDITRFRCGGRRFVTLGHPDYVDRVLHQARLRYVKSNEYEPVRARRRFLRRRHMNHTSSVGDRSTRSTRTPVARTTMSYRQTQPLVPSFRLKSATSDFGRPRASPCNDTPYDSEITTTPLKLKSRYNRTPLVQLDWILFMLAGHDTTSTTLSYALWALGRHREVQDRIAAEVAELGDRTLTSDDVPRLGYSVQVLHEAMRLCPPAAGVSRAVMQDIEVDGYRLEAGTLAAVGIYAIHRDPASWDRPLVQCRSPHPSEEVIGSLRGWLRKQ